MFSQYTSLIAGLYDRFIWVFKLKTLKSSQTLTLSQLFSYPSHLSPIKSVAATGTVAASEIDSLNDHSATVKAIAFYMLPSISFPRNLITAADDGTVCIYDSDMFVLLKTVNVHKKGINDLDVHLSGKLVLTVGRDSCFGMLNLVRGRRSFYCRLGKEASLVKFGCGGDKFFMAMEEKVSVHEVEDAKLLFELENQKRVLGITPGENGILFTGGEDKSITAWDTNS